MLRHLRSIFGLRFSLSGCFPTLLFVVFLTAFPGVSFAEDLGPVLKFTNHEQRVSVAPFEKAPNGEITIEFRMKIEEAFSGLRNLVGDGEGPNDFCFKVYFNGSTHRIYAYLQTTDVFTVISPEEIEPGLWYHIAYVADGANIALYVNGEKIVQIPYGGGLVNTDNPFFIGSDECENASIATMDEVRIWDTARTEQQIRYFMHQRIMPSDADFSDLGAYWRLDEGAGNTATDATGHGRDGSIVGTPKWMELEGCHGDFREDGFIDGSDLAYFASGYGWENCPEPWMCPGDFNGDTNVDDLDLAMFAGAFGRDDCKTKHVYAIIDVMVAESPYSEPILMDYTGLRFGECTGPYIPGLIGTQMHAVDVNTGIGGTTTGIWAKYAYLPLNWSGPVLVDIAVTHWPGEEWTVVCPDGWGPASGTSQGHPGALTTGTKTSCWRNGLCVLYEPFSDSDTFISNLCLSHADGSIPVMCETDGVYWDMEKGGLDIHKECHDDRFVYLGHNNAKPWPPMPQTIDFSDEEKNTLLMTYAPRVWLATGEKYRPSSVEWAFPHLTRFLFTNGYWLRTIEVLPEPSSVLNFFYGPGPVGSTPVAPVYAFFIKKQIPVGGIDVEVVDLVYFFYYPYNRGKEVVDTIFENHVGDWEHITVRLAWQYGDLEWEFEPSQVYVSAHDFGGAYDWDSTEIQKVDTHSVVYSAWGSHGLWVNPGDHVYGEAFFTDLIDECDAGTAWDTWENVVAFDYYDPFGKNGRGLDGSQWPIWMQDDFTEPGCDVNANPGCDEDPASGAIYRWGNPKDGEVFGYYRLTDGPTGPVSKGVMTSLPLQ
jgi:hypothetical protein